MLTRLPTSTNLRRRTSSSRLSLNFCRTRVSSRFRGRCSNKWRILEVVALSLVRLVEAISIKTSSISSCLTTLTCRRWCSSCLSGACLKEAFTRMLSLGLTQRGALSTQANSDHLNLVSPSMAKSTEVSLTNSTRVRSHSTTNRAHTVSESPTSGRTPSCNYS